jgi:hypothetical protein
MTKPDFAAHSPSEDKPEILAKGKGQVGIDLTMDEWDSGEDDLAYQEL